MLRAIEQAIRLTPVFLPLAGQEGSAEKGSYFSPALVDITALPAKTGIDSEFPAGNFDIRVQHPAFARTISLSELMHANPLFAESADIPRPLRQTWPDGSHSPGARVYSTQELLSSELPEFATAPTDRQLPAQIEVEFSAAASSFPAFDKLSAFEPLAQRAQQAAAAPAAPHQDQIRQPLNNKAQPQPPLKFPIFRQRPRAKQQSSGSSAKFQGVKSFLQQLIPVRA